ncbi:MAG: UDP-N-acetylmuramate dehydrogenase [Chloroflexota bacterium]|nr:UDP-N-acetylmuramate dehydrogenase [Chloroflexota bacterium]
MHKIPMNPLREVFGTRLQENVSMANYTTAHVGGHAAALVSIHSLDELITAARTLWDLSIVFRILGSGSNLLISDLDLNCIVLHNRVHNIKIDTKSDVPTIYAESGAILGTIARQSALRGLSGMEWAAPVPGTVGGAVYGNAGAHGSDMKQNLKMAKILHKTRGIEDWPVQELAYQYRSSVLKRERLPVVILSATINVTRTSREETWEKIKTYQAHRKETQPPGASMGSIFKNPEGDYAGRLIEAAGLKGQRIGHALISPIHANFIINLESAKAQDIYDLMRLAQNAVKEKFGILLEPEIELVGDFKS